MPRAHAAEQHERAVLTLVEAWEPGPDEHQLNDPETPSSPELVLVLPEAERDAAIQALPLPAAWNPEPLMSVLLVPHEPVAHPAVTTALVYFAAKLVWTVVTAAVYVVTIVAVVTMLTLIF